MTRKFHGYSQYPYKMKNVKEPTHLKNPDEPHEFKKFRRMKTEPTKHSQENTQAEDFGF